MKKYFKLFNWGLLSKHRTSIMACAILWVVLFHGGELGLKVMKLLVRRGNMGVDIFLLLSGIGLCFSYRKNPDPVPFYKRRIKRVLIPYLFIGGSFWVVIDLLWKKDVILFLKDITMLSFWKDGIVRVWYISLILILYTLFPLIWKMVCREGRIKKLRIVLLITVVMGINFILHRCLPDWFDKVGVALTRIPVFLIGIVLADRVWEKQPVKIWESLALFALCICNGWMNQYHIEIGFQRYWFAVWAIVICLLLAAVFELCEKNRVLCKLNKLLIPIGTWSLELYIVHVWVRRFLMKLEYNPDGYGVVSFVLLVIVSAVLTWCAVWAEKQFIFRNKK